MRNPFVCAAVSTFFPLLLSSVALSAPPSAGGQGISLAVTLGTDHVRWRLRHRHDAAGDAGDQVNYCYLVTNNSDDSALTSQSLADDVLGPILTDVAGEIAPGASYQYNRHRHCDDIAAPVSTWTAYDVHPDYVYTEQRPESRHDLRERLRRQRVAVRVRRHHGDAARTCCSTMTTTSSTGIGFPFTFYGHTAEQITRQQQRRHAVRSGNRHRTVALDYLSPNNRVLPDRMIGPAILPYWEDLQQDYLDGIGNVFVQTLGDAPNRRFVVEWFNLPVNVIGGGNTITFEAILFEGSNHILFQYSDTDCSNAICDNGGSATIGLNSDATHAMQYSFDQATVSARQGDPVPRRPTPATYSATRRSTLDVGAPVIAVDPTSFDKTVRGGLIDHRHADDRQHRQSSDLTWNIGSVGRALAFPADASLRAADGRSGEDADRAAAARRRRRSRTCDARARADRRAGVCGRSAQFATVVAFDAAAPSTLTSDARSVDGLQFLSGDFMGEDFRRSTRSISGASISTRSTPRPARRRSSISPCRRRRRQRGRRGTAWRGTQSTHTMFAVTFGRPHAGIDAGQDRSPTPPTTTLIGPITGVGDPTPAPRSSTSRSMPNGLMYGVDIVTDTLVAIDKTTGEASTIGSIGFDANFAEGLDFDDTTTRCTSPPSTTALGAGRDVHARHRYRRGHADLADRPDPTGTQYSALAIARLAGICCVSGKTCRGFRTAARAAPRMPGATTPITVTFDATTSRRATIRPTSASTTMT